jgi:hypothetical protein
MVIGANWWHIWAMEKWCKKWFNGRSIIRVSRIHKLWCWRCPKFLGRLLMEYSAENWIWWCGINIKDNIKKKNKEIWCLRRDIIIGAVGEKLILWSPPLFEITHTGTIPVNSNLQSNLSNFSKSKHKKGWKIQPFLILCKNKIVFCEQNLVKYRLVVVSAFYQCSK